MLQDPKKSLIVGQKNIPVPSGAQSEGPILLGVVRGSVSPVPSCPRSLAPDRHDIGHVLTTSFASRWKRWNFPHATLCQVCFRLWLSHLTANFSDWSNLKLSSDFMKAMILEGRLGTIKLELLFRTDRWVYCDSSAFTRWTCPSETCDAKKRNLSCLNLYVCTYDIDVYASLYY